MPFSTAMVQGKRSCAQFENGADRFHHIDLGFRMLTPLGPKGRHIAAKFASVKQTSDEPAALDHAPVVITVIRYVRLMHPHNVVSVPPYAHWMTGVFGHKGRIGSIFANHRRAERAGPFISSTARARSGQPIWREARRQSPPPVRRIVQSSLRLYNLVR
jgi:hypothetical protein